MVFLILWLNDIPIEKSEIVKHSAAAELAQLHRLISRGRHIEFESEAPVGRKPEVAP
ncbi:4-diphosphocytidyl-2-C-methyl-D-erythritol kinase [Labeo rohita]|uniref:4-diphosphocytidyl-2-C-methyl-D-erythritol kinase n=1 Tax=Labeo rohita TaxID=84645 RepID=A0ABQ8MXP4_LABRO|nr:4-diphosphocytidyl-2-C-methyl-D-erythritol kinase [Labeo rohita]